MTPIVSQEHREERKKIILNAAKEVFIKKGFHATTIQDIIDQSGISRGGVYTYFQNTEDVFLELLKRRDLEDVWDLDEVYEKGRRNWEALLYILDSIQDAIENERDLLVPAIYEYYFTTGRSTKKHLPFLETRISQAQESLSLIINRGVEDKEFSPVLPINDIARTIITFCDGIYLSCFHLGPVKTNIKGQFHAFHSYLALALKLNL